MFLGVKQVRLSPTPMDLEVGLVSGLTRNFVDYLIWKMHADKPEPDEER